MTMVMRTVRWIMRQHWTFIAGLLSGTIVALLLVTAPVMSLHDPVAQDLSMRLQGPGGDHWLGNDQLGRDLWARLLYGGRFSVVVAALTLVLSVTIGTLIGAWCGRVGGAIDEFVMRVVDVLISFPEIIVALFLIAIIGPGFGTLVLALTLVGWTPFARLARGIALDISSRDYIVAAEVLGCTRTFILLRHVIPNALRPISAMTFLRFGHKLITVGALSYLGLGIQPPDSDWGAMLADARQFAVRQPLLVFAPGIAIMVTALSVTLMGQGLEIDADRSRRLRTGES